jgi:hypothetical protein
MAKAMTKEAVKEKKKSNDDIITSFLIVCLTDVIVRFAKVLKAVSLKPGIPVAEFYIGKACHSQRRPSIVSPTFGCIRNGKVKRTKAVIGCTTKNSFLPGKSYGIFQIA